MRFYLSSYKLGDEADKIVGLMPDGNRRIGYVPNALDFTSADPARREEGIRQEMFGLGELGLEVTLLDLRDYFGKKDELVKMLGELGGVWVRGGNTFVLRQAMKLSGFDEVIVRWHNQGRNFLYGGYSAGVCVLAPSLKSIQIVDDPNDHPYDGIKETVWEGLGVLDYMIMPHYKSDHPESADVDKEIELCERNGTKYRPLRDGEVIIIN